MSEKIEEIYRKVGQLEHILIRPDTYIGPVEHQNAQMWVMNHEEEQEFENRTISFVPGLYKLFDEILVNAADNYQRDKRMNLIKVNINRDEQSIQIWNNGKGIPVSIHKEHNIYVPELIFGHLLTSSNYDDDKKKITGGRNGYGAKLANIFSKEFRIETADHKAGKKFQMVWHKNMSEHSEPQIASYDGSDYTCVYFKPDLKKFHMRELDDDIIDLMKKRVYDLAGIIGGNVKVQYNGKNVPIKDVIKVSDKNVNNERWEVIASVSDGQFQQVSFVNGICTSKGGSHVNYVADQICAKLMEQIKKKKEKGMNIKPFQIRQHLMVFVNCSIENPSFDSQVKETLTLKKEKFGSTCEISDKFIKDLMKSNIVNNILIQAKARDQMKMNKTLAGIPKLEDANDAGTKNAEHCVLFITEGDSAKSLAMQGMEVVGRDKYGVFPLKGKMLNVREATSKQITENNEIQNIIKSLGLQMGKKYENVKQLRYGSVMIMADQDNDGSHIKGLFLNFIQTFWPSLFQMSGFIKEFVTPLIKAKKGSQSVSFFTIQDYMNWLENQPNPQGWTVKYYKGLGTSTDKEAQEYFSNLHKHIIEFKYQDDADTEAMDLAFNKKKADLRKDWLAQFDPKTQVDHAVKKLRYRDFVNKELIQFSIADCQRSIPSICDGLKPEIKVAQLSGYVAEHSAYHHGEMSLAQTIIGMAQNFVGSNNMWINNFLSLQSFHRQKLNIFQNPHINYLMPIGQFGSRNLGGKDSASARYIHTNLNKLTRKLFDENDDHVLNYLEEDGQKIEPIWYLPIIPAVLLNGADGIGTGWSTSIPPYNPRELIDQIRKKMDGEEFQEMYPYYRGYTGEITIAQKGGFQIKGHFNILDDEHVEITELPIKKWTRDYKTFLEEQMISKDGDPDIKDIREYHAGNRVHFVIQMSQSAMKSLKDPDSIEKYVLQTSLQTTNMVLFNPEGKIQRYNSIAEILEEFYTWRLDLYQKRKEYLVSRIQRDVEILYNKKRFILAVIDEEVKVRNTKKMNIVEQLQKKGFKQMCEMTKIKSNISSTQQKQKDSDDDSDTEISNILNEYNYLLKMPIFSLTYEKVEKLKNQLAEKEGELKIIQDTSTKQMWKNDISSFEEILDMVEDEEDKELMQRLKKGQQSKNKKKASKAQSDQSDSDSEFDKPKKKKAQKKAVQNDEHELNLKNLEFVSMKSKITKREPPPKIVNERQKKNVKTEVKMDIENEPEQENDRNNENQSKKSPGLPESILKYLKPFDQTSGQNNDIQCLSLAERLALRQKQGDMKTYTDAYGEFKVTPCKMEPIKEKLECENGLKRKHSVSDDIDQLLQNNKYSDSDQYKQDKKVKIDEVKSKPVKKNLDKTPAKKVEKSNKVDKEKNKISKKIQNIDSDINDDISEKPAKKKGAVQQKQKFRKNNDDDQISLSVDPSNIIDKPRRQRKQISYNIQESDESEQDQPQSDSEIQSSDFSEQPKGNKEKQTSQKHPKKILKTKNHNSDSENDNSASQKPKKSAISKKVTQKKSKLVKARVQDSEEDFKVQMSESEKKLQKKQKTVTKSESEEDQPKKRKKLNEVKMDVESEDDDKNESEFMF